MRIYSNELNRAVIRDAVGDARPELTDVLVDITEVTLKGRRRRMTYDVTLEGIGAHHTRFKNTGKHGGGLDRAATWMEWGWLIAVLFRAEPTAVIGSYDGRDDFLRQTADQIKHRLRIDASARNFAVRYPGVWENPHADPWLNARPDVPYTSPFAHVDRVCPPHHLVPVHDPSALTTWLDAGRFAS